MPLNIRDGDAWARTFRNCVPEATQVEDMQILK